MKLLPFYQIVQGCSSSAYRTRAQRFPILPERREDIVLEGEWAQTADHQNFVLANNGKAEKLIIFGSVEGLLQVCRASTVYMDGTFLLLQDYLPNFIQSMPTCMDRCFLCCMVFCRTKLRKPMEGSSTSSKQLQWRMMCSSIQTLSWWTLKWHQSKLINGYYQEAPSKDVYFIMGNVFRDAFSVWVLLQHTEQLILEVL